ncbi:MAG: EamA family transporter [Paracoccaceae bacterium]|nr:EamA family transporter [Paracoccaceae bacterium]
MFYSLTRIKLKKQSSAVSGNLSCMAAVALFSFGFPAANNLLETWGVLSLITLRNFLGLLFLVGLMTLTLGVVSLSQLPWKKGFWIGFLGFGIGSMLLLLSQSMTNAVTAALAAATMPLCAVALEVALDSKRLTLSFLAGVALVLLGGLTASGIQFGDFQFGLGFLIGLCASSIFAWGSRATVKEFPTLTPLARTTVTTLGMTGFCALVFFGALIFKMPGTTIPKPTNNDFILLLIYAWCALGLSQWMWIHGVGLVGVGVASFHLNAAPFYVMLTMLVFGYGWSWLQPIGACVLAVGVIMAQSQPKRDSTAK